MIPDKHVHLPHTNTQQKSSNYFRSASSSQWHPVSFYPRKGKETDRQTIVCWIFMAVLGCQLLSFPQGGECRLKVNRCVGFCMYAGARHLLCVAWWRTAAPSNETRPILHCDRHLRETYDNVLKMMKLEFTSLRKTNAYFFCINCIAAVLHFSRPTHDSFTVHTNLVSNLGMRILKREKLPKLCFVMVTNCVQQS
jgi:hypothetical protein